MCKSNKATQMPSIDRRASQFEWVGRSPYEVSSSSGALPLSPLNLKECMSFGVRAMDPNKSISDMWNRCQIQWTGTEMGALILNSITVLTNEWTKGTICRWRLPQSNIRNLTRSSKYPGRFGRRNWLSESNSQERNRSTNCDAELTTLWPTVNYPPNPAFKNRWSSDFCEFLVHGSSRWRSTSLSEYWLLPACSNQFIRCQSSFPQNIACYDQDQSNCWG
jgi:hypothetical protein